MARCRSRRRTCPGRRSDGCRRRQRAAGPRMRGRCRAAPAGSTAGDDQGGEFLLERLILRSIASSSPISSTASRRRVLPGQVAWLDRRDQRSGLLGGQELLCPAREKLQQQPVQPVHRLGPGPAQLVTAVGEHAHHQQIVIDIDPRQAGVAQRDHRHRVRIDRVGLAAVAGREHPHLGRQLRRHIDHGLAVMDQAVRDVFADAVAALDRPHPFSERRACGEHLRVAGLVGAEPALASTAPRSSTTSIVAELLCGSIPMITPTGFLLINRQ